jgi:hypothetical protein
MLGSLAKWLRLMGYDAAYAQLEDDLLTLKARNERRLLLTRDTELARNSNRRPGVRIFLIKSTSLLEQLREVTSEFNLKPRETSFCPLCNVELKPVNKSAIQGKIPPYVFKTQKRFTQCPECHRLFWRGTHWQNFKSTLQDVLNTSKEVMLPAQNEVTNSQVGKSQQEANQ